jgi:2-amino-4-hydroxy-6-hydroxymethyldihydropteridine diphosphokinase
MSLDNISVAALGLGGNIGHPAVAMAQALRDIDNREDCDVVAVSRLYVTPPWGKTDQADFFNCCALVETALAPEELLELCLSIELQMKRVRSERWGPRTIDIDLLLYDDLERKTDALELPHPRMSERGFVLMPLADIAPEARVRGRAVREWMAEADISGIRVAREDKDWWREA